MVWIPSAGQGVCDGIDFVLGWVIFINKDFLGDFQDILFLCKCLMGEIPGKNKN